jgi:hypothetical protein
MMTETALYSETSAQFYQTTRSHTCYHWFPFRFVCKYSVTSFHCVFSLSVAQILHAVSVEAFEIQLLLTFSH